MNISTLADNRYRSSVLGWILLALPLGYGALLAWQEWQFRQSLSSPPALSPTRAPAQNVAQVFKPDAIATVLGLGSQSAWVPSSEPLQLRASFVSNQGGSQALLADAQGARFYFEGERLPSGSVLRRVEAGHVVLWRNGREERLTLKSAGKHLLPVSGTSAAAAPAPSLHLRPVAEQP